MTLEAAVVFPLVAGFLVSILFFFQVLKLEKQVQDALIYSARKTAASAAITDSAAVMMTEAVGYWSAALGDHSLQDRFVKNGMLGFNFLNSDLDEDPLTLTVNYTIRWPVDFFGIGGLAVTQSQTAKKWTGEDTSLSGDGDPYVYITEEGTVYHTTMNCTYLSLSIQEVDYAHIDDYRDESGQIYYACPLCAKGGRDYASVYITDYGERFHTDLNCPGLKRTIYMVRLSEVGNRGPCSKCGGDGI